MATNYKILGQGVNSLKIDAPANGSTIISELKIKNTSYPTSVDVMVSDSSAILDENIYGEDVVSGISIFEDNQSLTLGDYTGSGTSTTLNSYLNNGTQSNFSFDSFDEETNVLTIRRSTPLYGEVYFPDPILAYAVLDTGNTIDAPSGQSEGNLAGILSVNGDTISIDLGAILNEVGDSGQDGTTTLDEMIFNIREDSGDATYNRPFTLSYSPKVIDTVRYSENRDYIIKNKSLSYDEEIKISGGIALESGQSLAIETKNYDPDTVIIQAYGIEETA